MQLPLCAALDGGRCFYRLLPLRISAMSRNPQGQGGMGGICYKTPLFPPV
jgi:hypothetical protein